MVHANSLRTLTDLGPVKDHTPEQEAAMRRLVADQPDADELLDAMGVTR
jgi:hypothetical protein